MDGAAKLNAARTIIPAPWNRQILEPSLTRTRTLLHLRQTGERLSLKGWRYGRFFGSALSHGSSALHALFVNAFRGAAGFGCGVVLVRMSVGGCV